MTMDKVNVQTILDEVIATGAGTTVQPWKSKRMFQVFGNVSASTGAASVEVQGSQDGTNWVVLDTLTLTLGTTVTSDSGIVDAPWKYVRGNVGSISGTDATVSLFMGAGGV